jgi:hypothetical protein
VTPGIARAGQRRKPSLNALPEDHS